MRSESVPWNQGTLDSELINAQFFDSVDGVLRGQLVFKGCDGRKELGVIPVLDDRSDEEFGDFYAGVADRKLWIEKELC